MVTLPRRRFACPVHKVELGEGFYCLACQKYYPSVDGIPVLLNESNSVFRISDYMSARTAYGGASSYAGSLDRRSGLRQLYRRVMFRLNEAPPPTQNYDVRDAVKHILNIEPAAKILVVGAGDTSLGGDVTYTDVAFGRNVACIADAHDLPFEGGEFDACIVCAVLEHVADPYRCVDEIIRVLRHAGYVYAETPFMQPVHMRQHDFTRFTQLGHRRLFRQFDEIQSGICGGTGVSAGQILRSALSAMSDRPGVKKWLKTIGLIGTYPFRWLDYLSYKNNSAYDSASGFYFFGILREQPISDRDILTFYRGG